MRTTLLLCVAVLAAGCGGNWSNADLVFANALPRSEDLRSKLPASGTSQPLLGVATRRDGLMVGDPSNTWSLTRKASTDFNGIVNLLLGVVDQVRRSPPAARTADSRTWGPFTDDNNPGREGRVVITRTSDDTYAWSMESRAFGGEWLQIVTGNYLANGETTVRKGQGTIEVPVKTFRDQVKVDTGIAALDKITVGYVTDRFPNRVEMLFELDPMAMTEFSALGYTSLVDEDGGGSMRFLFTKNSIEVQELEITAAWKPTGEGRGLGVVRRGTYLGFEVTECWGRDFKVVHYAESWPGGTTSGAAASCATFP